MKSLPKIDFPIGVRRILATIGTYWHRIDAMVAFRESENPVYVSCILKESSDLYTGLIPVLLLGSMGIGKRCLGGRNNDVNSNPFADGFLLFEKRCLGGRNNDVNSNPFADGLLLSRESSKVSFELPEGFSVTAENGSSKVCFELLKTFRVTPKTLPPGCLSEVGQPVFFVHPNYKNSPWHGIIRFTFNAARKPQQNT